MRDESRADESASDEFAAFVAESSRRLLQLARLATGDSERAADLVQSAYANAYRHWPSVREGDPFAYVRRSIINANISWWRRRRGRPEVLVAEPPDWSAVADGTDDVVRRDLLRRALAGLSDRERVVLVLRFFEDLSERDIAIELGIAPGTVKSTSSRALAKLRLDPHLITDVEPSQEAPR